MECLTFSAPHSIHCAAFSSVIPPPTCRLSFHASTASLAASWFPGPSIMTCAPVRLCSLYSWAKWWAGRVETWFVLRYSEASVSVPPTICFTDPAWRSMQGRNRVMLLSWTKAALVMGTWFAWRCFREI